jgi:hypothetical protein
MRHFMAQLRALTTMQDPTIGGFIITFPSGLTKEVIWQSQVPAPNALTAAKEFTTGVLDQLLQEGRHDDANRTNWPSVVAAVQKMVLDFNAQRLAALRALENPAPIPALMH